MRTRVREQLAERHRPRATRSPPAAGPRPRTRLGVRARRAADDERPARALPPRVGQRLRRAARLMMSRATDAPRRAAAATARGRRVFSGVKSMTKKSGPGSADRRALRLHGQERPADLEGEAGGRAIVAEAGRASGRSARRPPATRRARTRRPRSARPNSSRSRAPRPGRAAPSRPARRRAAAGTPRRGSPSAASERAFFTSALGALEHVAAAVERGQRQQQLGHRGGGGQLAHQALERPTVLAPQGVAQLRGPRRGSTARSSRMPRKKSAWPTSIWKPLEAERAQPLHRHRDHLGVALGVRQPDQLHARLVELAVAAHVRLVVAEHVGDVVQPQRLGLLAHAGGHDARDLRRDVGAQGEQPAALAVHHLEHPLLQLVVGAVGEHVEVLVRAASPSRDSPSAGRRSSRRSSTARLRAASSGR